jgi:hypothetical protein
MNANPDSIITAITQAPSDAEALTILGGVGRKALEAVADQLYVDFCGRRTGIVRRECVREARA